MVNTSTPPRVPRILCLPGFGMNAALLRGKLSQINRISKGALEFIVIDPPNVLLLPTLDTTLAAATANITETTPRSWWRAESNDGFGTDLKELDRVLYYLREVLNREGPFDGVFGFSQGAATATLLTALVARPHLHPAFNNFSPRPFKFAIFCSGYLPLDKRVETWFNHKLETPSLHVLGRGDVVAPPERSLANVSRFINPRVEWHEGGHHVPRKAVWSLFFREYILSFTDLLDEDLLQFAIGDDAIVAALDVKHQIAVRRKREVFVQRPLMIPGKL